MLLALLWVRGDLNTKQQQQYTTFNNYNNNKDDDKSKQKQVSVFHTR